MYTAQAHKQHLHEKFKRVGCEGRDTICAAYI